MERQMIEKKKKMYELVTVIAGILFCNLTSTVASFTRSNRNDWFLHSCSYVYHQSITI